MASHPIASSTGDLIYRQRRPVRLWHWINALTVIVMLKSGLMIFPAHTRLYWGSMAPTPTMRGSRSARRRRPATCGWAR